MNCSTSIAQSRWRGTDAQIARSKAKSSTTQKGAKGPDIDVSEFNAKAFATYMNSHANAKSQKMCATVVRGGLEASGFDTKGNPRQAGDYGPFLIGLGFTPIPGDGGGAQVGDIAVFEINNAHEDGHIQMWNGSRWTSDFFQRRFIPYNSSDELPNYTIYRFGYGL